MAGVDPVLLTVENPNAASLSRRVTVLNTIEDGRILTSEGSKVWDYGMIDQTEM